MANPTLREGFINNSSFNSLDESSTMTVGGTILKTCFLGLLMFATFSYTWYLQLTGFADKAALLYNVGVWGGLGMCLAICFMPKNKFLILTTPLYAMLEGLALGYISALANKFYPGVVLQATIATFIALFSMLILYSTKVIRCTEKFRAVMTISIFSIFVLYMLQMILSLFHISIPFLYSNGPVGIIVNLVIVGVASFSLIMDFANIEEFSSSVDKSLEWYFGFSLMVTLVWLYIEMLQLFMKWQSNNN